MNFDESMRIFTDNGNYDFYQYQLFWRRVLKKNNGIFIKRNINVVQKYFSFINKIGTEVAIDIGANIGQSSIPYSKYFSKVFSFEAMPHLAEQVAHNIELSNVSNVEVINYALSNEEKMIGTSFCLSNPKSNDGTTFLKEGSDNSVQVKTKLLDSYLNNDLFRKVKFIKIDVEGHELFVLQGATNFIEEVNPDMFLIELNGCGQKNFDIDEYDVCLLLKNLGYSMFKPYFPFNKKITTKDEFIDFREKCSDFCFISEEAIRNMKIKGE